MLVCYLLMAGCTQDEEPELLPDSAGSAPIAFDIASEEPGASASTRAASGLTGPITRENYQLRYAGIGVFAATSPSAPPDMMFNQKVSFTVLADGSDNGYWSYSPLKYWPNDPAVADNLYFCAYAPYVESTDGLDADDTGIVALPSALDNTPLLLYARARQLENTVDLLWSYLRPAASSSLKQNVALEMHHALARVAVNVKLNAAPAAATKVLVRRITITPTTLVKSATLDLTSHDTYILDEGTEDETTVTIPTWSDRTWESTPANRVIIIDHDPATTPASYGVIDNKIRYVPGLPYSWQPAGLTNSDYTNALSTDDHQAYLYFIPQDDFEVSFTVAYTIMRNDGTSTTGAKTTTTSPYVIGTLRGNLTYNLNLNITLP